MQSDRRTWANSVDPDQTPQNAASDLGLHYLPLIQQFKAQQYEAFKVDNYAKQCDWIMLKSIVA